MSVKLPVADSLRLMVEDSAASAPLEQMSDSGDHLTFSCAGTRFSLCEKDANGVDRRPVVKPDGLQNGCLVAPAASGGNDAVDVSGGIAWIGGSSVTVSPQIDIAVTRPSASMKKISSVVIDGAGSVSVIAGTQAADYSNQRSASGGAPYIPLGKVELATVRLGSETSATLAPNEVVFAPEFTHTPSYRLLPYSATLEFFVPLPLIHTGSVARNVWITRYEPSFTQLDAASVRPPAMSFEIDQATGKASRAKLKTGSLVIALSGDQTDLARRIDGTVRLFEFMPDSTQTRKELFYAAVEIVADYTPGGLMTGAATLLPVEEVSIET